MAQALKIILTIAAQEVSHASRAVCPRLDKPTRENGYHRESLGGALRVRGSLHKAWKVELLPWAYRAYGYRYIPQQAGLLPQVAIQPTQAAVVRDRFRWVSQEQRHQTGLLALIRRLTQHGGIAVAVTLGDLNAWCELLKCRY